MKLFTAKGMKENPWSTDIRERNKEIKKRRQSDREKMKNGQRDAATRWAMTWEVAAGGLFMGDLFLKIDS